MKFSRNLLAVGMAFTAGAAFAAANDVLISFSTKGPDTYADGAMVMDGECYALVWTPAGSSGAVVAADGSAQGGEVVLTAPVAKNGRCPRVMFEVDAAVVSSRYKDGSWGVYLLDTRRFGEGGVVTLAGTSAGRAASVNASGLVPGSTVRLAEGQQARLAGLPGANASAESAVPDGTPRPEITGIRLDGANVYVTVKGTSPHLAYALSSGERPAEIGADAADMLRSGAASPDDEIVFVTPVKKGSAFFRVGRKTP